MKVGNLVNVKSFGDMTKQVKDHHIVVVSMNIFYRSLSSFPSQGPYHISRKLHIYFLTCHNFFSLSSVQIIIIPACCLLCVL